MLARSRRTALLVAAGALTCAACGSSAGAAGPTAAPGASAGTTSSAASATATTPSPTPSSTPSDDAADLLGSAPATLDALRAAEALRPVQVLVPGVARPAPVEPRTTDPVSGGLDLPEGAATVAWWASGAVPGTGAGAVVLAAHVSYDGETGPFTRLAATAAGTQVVVVSADGSRHAYAVQSTRNAPKTSLDRAELFRTTGPPVLVMVTCGGPYDRRTHTFAENVVVTAVPV